MKLRYLPFLVIVVVGISFLFAWFARRSSLEPLSNNTKPPVKVEPIRFAPNAERVNPGMTPGTEWMIQLKEDEIEGFAYDEARKDGFFSWASMYDSNTKVGDVIRCIKNSYLLKDTPSHLKSPVQYFVIHYKSGDGDQDIRVPAYMRHDKQLIYGDHWQSQELYHMVMKWGIPAKPPGPKKEKNQ